MHSTARMFFKTKLIHVMMESSRKCNVRNLSHNVPMCKRFMHCVFNSLCRFMWIHWFWLAYYHLYMRDTGVEMNQTRLLQHMSFIYVEICPEQWWWYIGIVPQEFKNILVPSQNIQPSAMQSWPFFWVSRLSEYSLRSGRAAQYIALNSSGSIGSWW